MASRRLESWLCHSESARIKAVLMSEDCIFFCPYLCTGSGVWAEMCEHMKMHSDKLLDMCFQCPPISDSQEAVQQHLHSARAHDPPYRCDQCDYTCFSEQRLQLHSISHQPADAYRCTECSFVSRYSDSLREHLAQHRRQGWAVKRLAKPKVDRIMERTNQCRYCSLEFGLISQLDAHVIEHYTIGPLHYSCLECNFQMGSRTAALRHVVKHRKETKLQCCECEFRTLRHEDLRRHRAKNHIPSFDSTCHTQTTENAEFRLSAAFI